jgi:HD-GYP domain-containing protein (c-di-GMP phosphodiesterase class II)
MAASETDPDFTPIRVATLRGDLKIPFDVYIKIAGKFIHYCRRGSSFEGSRLDRLKSKKLKKMFIRPEDEIPYRQYLEASIDAAYGQKDKPIEIRAEVIQGFQQAEAEQYMEDPMDEMSYKHVRSSVQRFVEFLEKEPRSVQALLKLKNTDHSVTHHSVNVASLSASMVIETQMREGVPLHLLALGCMVHDIEHFYSDMDLTKPPSQMPKEELEVYERHPLAGAHRLQGVTFLDQLVVNIITQHEEHADGSGFPKGLLGDEMDPLVLIAATANAYDRLISFESLSPKDALKTLLIDKMGVYPLNYLQALQDILKKQGLV